MPQAIAIEPFKIDIPETELVDLKRRPPQRAGPPRS
jgi:hypothetical protein